MNETVPIAAARTDDRAPLIGLERSRFDAALAEYGVTPGRARRIWQWIYLHGARDFSEMSDVSARSRAVLEGRFRIGRPDIAAARESADGTRKWLLRMADGRTVETVYIPDGDASQVRGTVCVSSQVGCTLNCSFCHTGTQKLVRNLTAGEILQQIMVVRDAFGEWPAPATGRRVSKIVLMGMGEPLYNFDHAAAAMRVARADDGLGVSRRRITVSTSGVVPMIPRWGEATGSSLAISLHAVTDELRDRLVPINRKYPIAELLAACRAYPRASGSRRILFEYVMLDGVNDSDAEARELTRLLRDLPAKINLLPYNPWPGSPYGCSSPARMRRFAEILNAAHLSAPLRTPRGRDIMAACGQLKTAATRGRRERVV
jgi:23S rRNA (adenine2503-C2)-methyltransferase